MGLTTGDRDRGSHLRIWATKVPKWAWEDAGSRATFQGKTVEVYLWHPPFRPTLRYSAQRLQHGRH